MATSGVRLLLLTGCLAACAPGEITVHTEGFVDSADGVPTFLEFERQSYREPGTGIPGTGIPGTGIYVVNGDTPVPNSKSLREYYDSLFHTELAVAEYGGNDRKWPESVQRDLSYCISDQFGSYKAQVISAMQTATEEGWHQAADVRFVYDPTQDSSCGPQNNSVLFDIRPTSNAPYLARAFFPGQARSSRNVLIDGSAFNTSWPLHSVLAHELGHVLGFRHEHTRPEAGTCFEDNDWRPLTPYDSASIMHYPQCNGASYSLSFSETDFQGAAALYGSPASEGSAPTSPPAEGQAESANVSGSLQQGQQIQYQAIAVLGGTPIDVRMTGTGDADLYLRFDGQASTTQFDCRPYRNGSTETCSVDVPVGGSQAYIMVRGYSAATYTLGIDWIAPN